MSTITPEPNFFARKKHQLGNLINEYLDENIGKNEPIADEIKIIKIDKILKLVLPSKSFSVGH